MGVDKISSGVYDVMNADQYSQYIGQACTNSGTPIPGGYKLNPETGRYQFMDNTDTDWFNEVFKTGVRQNHNVNLSGGGAHNTYNIALDYFQQKGTLEGAGPNYKRYTARVNNTMETNSSSSARVSSIRILIKTTWGSLMPLNTCKVFMEM